MSLQEPSQKMSKSDENPNASIYLMDDPDTIMRKCKRAVTDSEACVAYRDEQPGVKNLIRYQQNIAAESGIAFWNMFEAMGGEGSMANLVHAKPSMANYDYTHINFRGGKHLAGLLYETLIYGKEQYDRRRAYEQE